MGEIGRQRGTDARPEDRHQHVAGDRFRNLRLKAPVGLVEVVFPQHRFETDQVLVVAVELRRDRLHPPAFRRHVDRRRYENPDDAHRLLNVKPR